MRYLTRSFTLEEMTCRDGTEVPEHLVSNALHWCERVGQPIRDVWGPVIVVGPYRTPTWNIHKGGAMMSTHMFGQVREGGPVEDGIAGLDVRPMRMTDLEEFRDLILSMWHKGALKGLGGLGYYPRQWLHLDTKVPADGHLRRWDGRGEGSEKP